MGVIKGVLGEEYSRDGSLQEGVLVHGLLRARGRLYEEDMRGAGGGIL